MNGSARERPGVKPLLRGVSHEIAFYVAVFAGIGLCLFAAPGRATTAAGVYALSLMGLFGISALYHRPMWSPAARARMRRLDHSAIFLLIAGTYTPILTLAIPPEAGTLLLRVVWAGAALGIAKSILWSRSPRFVTAVLYVLLGWAVVGEWSAVRAGLGGTGTMLLIGGGLLYTIGAVVYARRRPDPVPHVFGYHEVFHLLVIGAAVCHFVMVCGVLVRYGATGP